MNIKKMSIDAKTITVELYYDASQGKVRELLQALGHECKYISRDGNVWKFEVIN